MSLYADYVKEREGKEILESPDGFAVYQFLGTVCYIVDLYVVPEKRRTHIASFFADEISRRAKDEGCTHLLGSVSLHANAATESIVVLARYGFKVREYKDNLLWFVKEL